MPTQAETHQPEGAVSCKASENKREGRNDGINSPAPETPVTGAGFCAVEKMVIWRFLVGYQIDNETNHSTRLSDRQPIFVYSQTTEKAKIMQTLDLLTKALAINPSPKAWCDKLQLNRAALNVARNRGRLSPAIAGGLAIELGEDAQQWIAVAALEAEPESPLLQRLKNCQNNWRKR